MMIREFLRWSGFGGLLIGIVLVGGAVSVGAVTTGVVVASGSPFHHTCAPSAVRGYLVEPTATTFGGSGAIIAGWQADRAGLGSDGIVAATSLNGGRSWATDVVPDLARCEGGKPDAVSDPWLSAGADGTVYLASDAVTGFRSTIAVSRSLDDGRSWQRPVVLERARGGTFSDKPTLTADPYVAGVAFAAWNDVRSGHGRRVMFSRTIDGGRSWSTPRVVAHSAHRGAPNEGLADAYPEIAVLPDETLTLVTTSVLASRSRSETLEHCAQTSTDLGASWSHQRAVDRLNTAALPDYRTRTRQLFIRADPDVFSLASGPQGIYLVSGLVEPRSRGRLVMSRERPDGTWSPTRTIATTNALAVLPTVAVNSSGKLGVTWDLVKPPNRGGEALAAVEAAVSDDGGRSWNARRLGRPFVLPHLSSELFIGDYQALTPAQSGFDAIDISSRGTGRKVHTVVESFIIG